MPRDFPVSASVKAVNGNEKLVMKIKSWLFHSYFLLRRPMTLGVRAIVLDETERQVFLVRHTYVKGWHFPGGGVERGETFAQALTKELREEGHIELDAAPQLFGLYKNNHVTNRDHVALYICRSFRQTKPRLPDREIAEARFFPLDALPDGVTSATMRRLDEVMRNSPPDAYW